MKHVLPLRADRVAEAGAKVGAEKGAAVVEAAIANRDVAAGRRGSLFQLSVFTAMRSAHGFPQERILGRGCFPGG